MGNEFNIDNPISVSHRYESGKIIPLEIPLDKFAQPICYDCSEKDFSTANTLRPLNLTPGPVRIKQAFQAVCEHLDGRDLSKNGEVPTILRLRERSCHHTALIFEEFHQQ